MSRWRHEGEGFNENVTNNFVGNSKRTFSSLGGLEPPTFRLTAERAADYATETELIFAFL